jgi:DNA-binding NtrC family response regulator
VETAVEALKLGAFDYVTKPVDPDELSNLVRNAFRQKDLAEENLRLKETVTELALPSPIVGESPGMRRILEMIPTVAETDSTVVVLGESGTGKELVARAIHAQSKRRFAPLVAVNCGSIPETLLGSELFGHEKGAYTGAQYRRKGKIELAHGGTLFLDEIGDITPKMQIDLLRVLESRSFTRLGGNQEIHSDFRLVCATNKNLEELVAAGSFREDFYYRIKVFSIELPPLRERRDDILPLARHFVSKYARAMGKAERGISREAGELLERYRWPGNVRELENAIERAMVIGREREVRPEDLPFRGEENGPRPDGHSLEAMEKEHIERVLREMEGNVSRSAKGPGDRPGHPLQQDQEVRDPAVRSTRIHLRLLPGPRFPPTGPALLVRELGGLFPREVRLLEAPLDLRPAYSPERNQYHATLLLASLLRTLPEPGP